MIATSWPALSEGVGTTERARILQFWKSSIIDRTPPFELRKVPRLLKEHFDRFAWKSVKKGPSPGNNGTRIGPAG